MVTQIGSQPGNIQAFQLVQKRNGMGDAVFRKWTPPPQSGSAFSTKSCMEWGLVRFTVTLSSFSKVAVTTPAMVQRKGLSCRDEAGRRQSCRSSGAPLPHISASPAVRIVITHTNNSLPWRFHGDRPSAPNAEAAVTQGFYGSLSARRKGSGHDCPP